MPLVSIVTVCRNVANLLIADDQEITFGHGERDWQNIIVDAVEGEHPTVMKPGKVIYLDEPIKSNDTITANERIIPSYPLSFVFGCKTEFDNTPEQHEPLITQMRDLARKYVLLLLQEKDQYDRRIFSEVSGMSRINFINLFDANMSGCVLELKVKPLSPESICV